MDEIRLVVGLYLTLATLLASTWFRHLEAWHGSVVAMHLHWNRTLALANPGPITLEQRQSTQAEFENVLARKPVRSGMLVLGSVLVLFGFGIAMAWDAPDREWLLRWLFAPLLIVTLIVLVSSWWVLRDGARRMRLITTTLYPRPMQIARPAPQAPPAGPLP